MADIWTQEDERKLQAMQQRRKETHERQSAALMEVIRRRVSIKSGSVSDVSIYDLRTAMIEHGGEFRDALEPFDHMGRDEVRAVDVSGWSTHDGGGSPVSDEAWVEAEYRNGLKKEDRAVSLRWRHGDAPSNHDIVAYRVIS